MATLHPPHSSQTISQPSHSWKTTSTTPAQNILILIFILFVGSSNKDLFGSFIALPMTWLWTHLWRPYHWLKLSILLQSLGSHQLEGECWDSKHDFAQMSRPDYSCCTSFSGSHCTTMPTLWMFLIVVSISFDITTLLLLSSRASFLFSQCS